MSTASNQESMKKYERHRDLLFKENNQAAEAVLDNNISKVRSTRNPKTNSLDQSQKMSNAEAVERYKVARDNLIKENKQANNAIMNNNISKMEKIFKTGGIEQEAFDELIFFVKSVQMMKLFLRYGGDMHKVCPAYYPHPFTLLLNYTALLRDKAVDSIERREMAKLVEFLIEEGADVNAVDRVGDTPFMNCVKSGDVKLCKFLVEKGADPSAAKLNNGVTALHAAACLDRVDLIRYLVEDCGTDIDAECQDEVVSPTTPLCVAALNGNNEVCKYLLERGAKVDAGNQPLLFAAEVDLLLISRTVTRM
jgi:hypothetical protein